MTSAGAANGGLRCSTDDLVAYFCAEFGFHESLPIYSGGLGILAGDHCKAASDMRLPFVGGRPALPAGLLRADDRRRGQPARRVPRLRLRATCRSRRSLTPTARELRVERRARRAATCRVRIWQARVGHVTLVPARHRRAGEQRARPRHHAPALRRRPRRRASSRRSCSASAACARSPRSGIEPTVWHMNEGHAAFLVLERVRALVTRRPGLRGGARGGRGEHRLHHAHAGARRATTISAHDDDASATSTRSAASVGIDTATLLALGRTPGSDDFNMTALAVRGSRFHNGVSRIHGGVSSRDAAATSGRRSRPRRTRSTTSPTACTCRTFLAPEWVDVFDRYPRPRLERTGSASRGDWQRDRRIPDHVFWCVRQHLKSQHAATWCATACAPSTSATSGSESHLDRLLRYADPGEPQRSHHRLRAPLRHLQARDAAVQGSRLAARRSSAIRSGPCCSSSRARRTRPTCPART